MGVTAPATRDSGAGAETFLQGACMADKVGIADVATAAGVSISTVSVVLNGVAGARVSPVTRERIRAVADSLGYVPNRLAAGLRRQNFGIVGFLSDTVVTTPY